MTTQPLERPSQVTSVEVPPSPPEPAGPPAVETRSEPSAPSEPAAPTLPASRRGRTWAIRVTGLVLAAAAGFGAGYLVGADPVAGLEDEIAGLQQTKASLQADVATLQQKAGTCQDAVTAASAQLDLWSSYLDNMQRLATTSSRSEATSLLTTMSGQYKQIVQGRAEVARAVEACG